MVIESVRIFSMGKYVSKIRADSLALKEDIKVEIGVINHKIWIIHFSIYLASENNKHKFNKQRLGIMGSSVTRLERFHKGRVLIG